jgi:SWI/SNF-related matrix-associated actin-dependent regulator of chromatin subfamily A3
MASRIRKRPAEVIDLTDDDNTAAFLSSQSERANKSQKLTSSQSGPSSYGPSSSSTSYAGSQRVFQADPDDGEFSDDELDDALLSQSFSDRDRYVLYGSFPSKVVGCRFYNGYVTMGEMVLLRRQPENQYDANAIVVNNVRVGTNNRYPRFTSRRTDLSSKGEQIGHIPRTMALKLAPFMDRSTLIVEGATAGPKNHYECPLELRLYGSNNPIERSNNKAEMQRLRLPIDGLRQQEQSEKRREKELADRNKLLQKALKKGGAFAGNGGDQQWNLQSSQYAASQTDSLGLATLDDIMRESERFNPRNADEMAAKFGLKEETLKEMPMADQPSFLETQLLPYQRQGLKWLLEKESPVLPPAGSKESVQLWKRSERNPNLIVNIATNFTLERELPALSSGGILADDMGLGKTMQVISLILADRELKVPRKNAASNTTLILAPLSVMSNWSSQIKRHVKEAHALKVLTYHGAKKVPITPKTITDWDVVVTTYDTVRAEHKKSNGKKATSGISSINWRRVVLDEGHNIRNPASKTANAVYELEAQSRWALSGTPIINSLKDLFSLARFLRLSGGLDRFEIFNGAIIRPLNQGQENAGLVLQALMGSICLRRTKDMAFVDLKLPECQSFVTKVDFLPHEKEKYDALEAEAKGTLKEYQSRRTKTAGDATKAYRHLLEILLRLRQVCNHWKLCGEKRLEALQALDGQVILDLTPENKAALEEMLQLNIDAQDDCPVCMDTLSDPVITVCTHAFCFHCIEKVIETQKKCPMCRAPLEDTSKLVRPAKEEISGPEIDVDESSSKIEALLGILNASRQKGSGNKTVVFSQWTSFLDIIEKQLDKHHFKYARIDGTMSATTRDASMEALEQDPETTVLLASLGVGSVGLNLVAANQVILADSWW